MPSSTFFNLPREKREKLLNAARAEFARVPYAEASINKIIHTTGISRGSFYMYFRDKDELFFHMMEEYEHRMTDYIIRCLNARNGDVFAAFSDLFDEMAACFDRLPMEEETRDLIAVFRSNSGGHLNAFWPEQIFRKLCSAELLAAVNREQLDLKSESELIWVLDLLFGVTGRMLCRVIRGENEKEARQNFDTITGLLKRGMAVKTGCRQTD